jgi:hypothetical protein
MFEAALVIVIWGRKYNESMHEYFRGETLKLRARRKKQDVRDQSERKQEAWREELGNILTHVILPPPELDTLGPPLSRTPIDH